MAMKLPEVLSIQRGTIVTDGIMSSIIRKTKPDGEEYEILEPIRVIRHGIRGITADPDSLDVYNIQRTESAKTSPKSCGLHVEFSIRYIPARGLLFACSDASYRKAFNAMIERMFLNPDGCNELDEVCRRYARNILNGRWLWRNRVLGEVTIEAKHLDQVYSGAGSTLSGFDDYTSDEIRLAQVIAGQLRGVSHDPITVSGRVMFGFTGEVEVFPSQNMVTGKPDGFARSLYKVDPISRRDLLAILAKRSGEDAGEFAADMIDMGIAAIRDQKIGNAIRTIDTWYPDYAQRKVIIPIEPNGASIELNDFCRDRNAAKALLSSIDEIQSRFAFDQDLAYLLAVIVRGGVFSEKDEERQKEKRERKARAKAKAVEKAETSDETEEQVEA